MFTTGLPDKLRNFKLLLLGKQIAFQICDIVAWKITQNQQCQVVDAKLLQIVRAQQDQN